VGLVEIAQADPDTHVNQKKKKKQLTGLGSRESGET
jgi:hypothetical protein